ncbi:hypothetical protein N9H06_05870, partial [Planktomarina temperata]|nr:hypothetical protein [Planktomarina temperata]
MTEIDYANARPLDVHRWSEYPEVNDLVGHVSGSQSNDTIIGNELDNEISGNDGNDTLFGGAGNDVFNRATDSRDGVDTMHGG